MRKILFLVLSIAISGCFQEKTVEEKSVIISEEKSSKQLDATRDYFDAGTIELLEHYAATYDQADEKTKVDIGFKLTKALKKFHHPMQGVKLLKSSEKISSILSFYSLLESRAIEYEKSLKKDNLKQIFAVNPNSLIALNNTGIAWQSTQCNLSIDNNQIIDTKEFLSNLKVINDFFQYSDLYFFAHYIDNLTIHLKDESLKRFYTNLKSYYPNKTLAEAKLARNNLWKTFEKITKNKISFESLKKFYSKNGACYWSHPESFIDQSMKYLTLVRGEWVVELVKKQNIEFKENELVSVTFSKNEFPYDRPLDAWNKFFKFRKNLETKMIYSEGKKVDDLTDDIEIEIK